MAVVTRLVATESFRDVPRGGRHRVVELLAKFEVPRNGRTGNYFPYRIAKFNAKSPCPKVFITSNAWHA
jgi:hypothetical protein